MFENRSKKICRSDLENLCFIGRYQRCLPVNLSRMMENAYDWEHLPHVHSSSFKRIDLVEQGEWGWRAVVLLPDNRQQHLELLVDKVEHYWATTVLSGDAKGFQIHTQATEISDKQIEVVVKFYLPSGFSKVLAGLRFAKIVLPFRLYKKIAKTFGINRVDAADTPKQSILKALHYQYSVLYDEDQALMRGRQQAIDRRKQNHSLVSHRTISLGSVESVLKELPKVVQFGKHRYVVNQWQGDWLVYAAECPHRLGPLEHSKIDDEGRISCPWHGYKFDVINGKSCSNYSLSLPIAPDIAVVDGELILTEKPALS